MFKILKYLNFKNFVKEIEGYGYNYSVAKYCKNVLLSLAAAIVMGMLLDINNIGIVILAVIVIMCFPYLIILHFRYLYEADRFEDVTDYMENMICSMERTGKIFESLKETLPLTEGKLKELVIQAVNKINQCDTYENIYREALGIIEAAYKCPRMEVMHDFFIKIEMLGGNYTKSLEVIMSDLEAWKEITYNIQKERKTRLTSVTACIAMSILVVVIMLKNLAGINYIVSLPDNLMYQISSVMFLGGSLLLYLLSQHALVRSWVREESAMKESEIKKDLDIIKKYDVVKAHKKDMLISLIFTVGIVIGVIQHSIYMVVVSMSCIFFLYGAPERHVRFAKKRITKEVQKAFPKWVRAVSLNLQIENTYMAMLKTIPEAPYVLREELKETLELIEKNPGELWAYNKFFEGLKLNEIRAIFKMFYALTEYGSTEDLEAAKQIEAMIDRNNKLSIKAEKLANEDTLAILNVYALFPMVLGGGKLLMDMWCFVQMFLEATQLM